MAKQHTNMGNHDRYKQILTCTLHKKHESKKVTGDTKANKAKEFHTKPLTMTCSDIAHYKYYNSKPGQTMSP